MKRIVVIVMALAVIGAGTPASAGAAPFTREMNLAYALGVEYWGEPTDCGTVEKGVVSESWLEEFAGGVAAPGAAATEPHEWRATCGIYFGARPLPWQWSELCLLMAHEVGHLTGHQHSTDPGDIMFPTPTVTTPPCRREETIHRRADGVGIRRFYVRGHCRADARTPNCWGRADELSSRLRALQENFWAPLTGGG